MPLFNSKFKIKNIARNNRILANKPIKRNTKFINNLKANKN